MREIIKMIVVLSGICGLAGFALAQLKAFSDPLIEQQVLKYVKRPAVEYIFSDADANPTFDQDPIANLKKFKTPDGTEVTVFPAIKDGTLQAVALEAFGTGFGGDIGVMVGFAPAGDKLYGIGVTTLKETPGLGMRVTESGYTGQFREMDPAKALVKADGGDIDAVSGATISSRGTAMAIQTANKVFQAIKPEIDKAWQ
ncbi:MAG: RnfABCDGE type electron transport complex subunit G [Desulfovibrionaceae bacterium]